MRLRWRFSLWFAVAALVPIALAAVVTREIISRSYRDDFGRQREAAERQARDALARVERAVEQNVEALASPQHPLIGGLLVRLRASGGVITPEIERSLREKAGPDMRGLGLAVLFVVDAEDVVLEAPHHRPANDVIDRDIRRRAERLAGRSFYTTELVTTRDSIAPVLVVESARIAREGPHEVVVAGGRAIDADFVAALRQDGRIDARLVMANGEAVIPADHPDWRALSSAPPIRLALPGPDGDALAHLELVVADANLHRLLQQITLLSLGLAGAALVATILLGLVVSRRMTRHLDRLVEGAQAAARGNLDHRVEVDVADEIGEVADAFNLMMEDLRTSKERLVIAQRIAAWQEIARRLAHEIKNPLTPIQMSVETMRKTWTKKHPSFEEIFEESTATILEETARLKHIVSEFSEFARLPKPQVAPCDLNDLVGGALALYEGAVKLDKRLAPDLPAIDGDRDQLHQVILNLLENARDALARREDGTIAVETRLGERRDRVQLIVEDDGPGIPADVVDRLFTPYFTTKHGQGGTGLGLAIVHRIVSDHGGRIWVEQGARGGARFVIELPLRMGQDLYVSMVPR